MSENPGVDISWLPGSITAPKHAFVTLAKELEGDFTTEVRPEIVVRRERSQVSREYYIADYGLGTFFDNGHPGMGEPVPVDVAVSEEELAVFSDLYTRFQEASHAVIAAVVNDNFSTTPVTPNELWTPAN